MRKAVNVLFDRPRGAVTQRLGTTLVGSAAIESNKTVQGVFNHRSATTSNHRLYGVANGTIYGLSGSTWASESGSLDSSTKCRFITYLDRTAILNGINGIRHTDGGGSWSNIGGPLDAANWPITSAAALLNGRVFAIGNTTNPSRLYKSSIVATNAISWTSGNGFVDIFPNDGAGPLEGITSNGRVLLLFKYRGMYRYDDTSLDRIASIGTPSHESIATDDNGITYFFGQGVNTVGIYATTGGYPKKISRPIQRWIEAISPSFYSSINAYCDGTKVVWSVGSITLGDFTYPNCQLVYNISDQTWETRNYAHRYLCFAQYIDSSLNITTVGGDTTGRIQTINLGNTDNGTPIYSECEFRPIVLGSRARTKTLDEIFTYAQDFQGLEFYMGVDGPNFKKLGSINSREQLFAAIANLKGHTFYPKITGVNSGPPFTFEGFNVNKYTDEGYVGQD